jgi:ribosome-binding protein aMBF1 (putative translation factor)
MSSTTDPSARQPSRPDQRTRDLYRGIARQVMHARVSADLTQKQLAARIGTTASVICRLESGQHKMSVETLARIAFALDLPFEVTLGRRPERRGTARVSR